MFSLKQLAISVGHILHPLLPVIINLSEHYKVEAHFPSLEYILIFKKYVDYYYPKLNVVIRIKSHYI